ncbi:hypothetical protein CVV72_03220 [Amycolatopsis sp. TNS106]|nr:hypothetical protein CVV72_03220 [Amycolatopsis sp. TNS106]
MKASFPTFRVVKEAFTTSLALAGARYSEECCESHFRNTEGCESGFRNVRRGRPRPNRCGLIGVFPSAWRTRKAARICHYRSHEAHRLALA